MEIQEYPFVDISTENQSGTPERKPLIFTNAPVALLTVQIRVGFKQTIVSELRVASPTDFLIPFVTCCFVLFFIAATPSVAFTPPPLPSPFLSTAAPAR
ncbi:MAG: hypothetical protein ACKO4W_00820, partial [Bacteroidota bacterium]